MKVKTRNIYECKRSDVKDDLFIFYGSERVTNVEKNHTDTFAYFKLAPRRQGSASRLVLLQEFTQSSMPQIVMFCSWYVLFIVIQAK